MTRSTWAARLFTVALVPAHVALLLTAMLLSPLMAHATLTETCLTGTAADVANDPSQIRAVRSLIDAVCICANFNGSKGKTHSNYAGCAAGIVTAEVNAAALRPQCKRTVKLYYSNSTCGRNPNQHTEPCIQTDVNTAKVTCAIKATTKKDGVTPTTACDDTAKATRVGCPTYTLCIDSADTNGDLIIGAPGDSGSCVLPPTATPTGTPIAPPTATPTSTATTTPTGPFVLVLATGGGGSVGGIYTPDAGWTTASIATPATEAPGLAMTDAGIGVGVIRDTTDGIQYTTWNGTAWSTPAAVGVSLTTRARPAIYSTGTSTAMAYQGDDFKYYFTAYSGSWSTVEQVGSPQSFGPVGPDITGIGDTATIAFIDGSPGALTNHAVAQTRTSGAWGAESDVSGSPNVNVNIPPSIAALTSGPEFVMVYVNGTQVMATTRTGGSWSAPAPISNALTNNRIALAPAAGSSAAVLAFRGTDSMLYWSVFSGGAWSTIAPVLSPNPSIITSPALAPGIVSAMAELVYLDSSGAAFHTRLVSGAWTAPVLISATSSLSNIAVTSGP